MSNHCFQLKNEKQKQWRSTCNYCTINSFNCIWEWNRNGTSWDGMGIVMTGSGMGWGQNLKILQGRGGDGDINVSPCSSLVC